MVIGLILLGITAALLFSGLAERVFRTYGATYWLAFITVAALIGSAFIPTFNIGVVTVSVAGFIAPLVFAIIFFVFAARTHEASRAFAAMFVVIALSLGVWLLVRPITNGLATVTVIILGFLNGAAAYLTAKTKLAALAAVFAGMPIAEVIAALIGAYALADPIGFGTGTAFDAIVLAAVFSVVLYEAVSKIKRTSRKTARQRAEAESASDFDPQEYKKYFDEK